MNIVMLFLIPLTDLTDAHLAFLRADHLHLFFRELEAFLLSPDTILASWLLYFVVVSHQATQKIFPPWLLRRAWGFGHGYRSYAFCTLRHLGTSQRVLSCGRSS